MNARWPSALILWGMVLGSKQEDIPSHQLPDFSKLLAGYRGIDVNAVPNIIVAGVAKGGSTNIWNLIEAFDDGDFVARPGPDKPPLSLEKEFNLPFVSGDFIRRAEQYPCPAETLQMLMRCPMSIMPSTNDENGRRNVTKCAMWLDGQPETAYKTRVAPRYTMDAYPYLMRNNHGDMKNILILNKANTKCKFKGNRRPLLISLVRDPYARVISYYNYFILRSAAVPLERMLEDELDVFERTPRVVQLLRVLENHAAANTNNSSVTSHEAHTIIHAYERLRLEMKRALAFEKTKNPGKNFEAEGILLDNIYLPQLLGLLFPVIPAMNHGDADLQEDNLARWGPSQRAENNFPLLVLQSELLFSHMKDTFEKVLAPYFYAEAKDLERVLDQEKKQGVSETGIFINSKNGHYSPLCSLSDKMKCRLYSFYFKVNKHLVRTLYRLQQAGKIVVAPKLPDPDHLWWERNGIPGCNPS